VLNAPFETELGQQAGCPHPAFEHALAQLFNMTSPAEQVAAAGTVDAIDPEERLAGRGAALLPMHIVAGSAFDFVIGKQ
jgi:hypothetical protein